MGLKRMMKLKDIGEFVRICIRIDTCLTRFASAINVSKDETHY